MLSHVCLTCFMTVMLSHVVSCLSHMFMVVLFCLMFVLCLSHTYLMFFSYSFIPVSYALWLSLSVSVLSYAVPCLSHIVSFLSRMLCGCLIPVSLLFHAVPCLSFSYASWLSHTVSCLSHACLISVSSSWLSRACFIFVSCCLMPALYLSHAVSCLFFSCLLYICLVLSDVFCLMLALYLSHAVWCLSYACLIFVSYLSHAVSCLSHAVSYVSWLSDAERSSTVHADGHHLWCDTWHWKHSVS